MADQTSESTTSPAHFVFDPPPGGDISLRSSDGKLFYLHSIILGLASSVFSDMFAVVTHSAEVLDLAEDSEAVSLMLGFIYPSVVSPVVNTFELLEKSLKIAQKYNVEVMLKKLDRALSQERSYEQLTVSDPLRLFYLSVTYGLRESQTAAAKSIHREELDLLDVDNIVRFARKHPSSAHLIGLVGTQSARTELLFQFLFGLSSSYELAVHNNSPNEDSHWLICKDCRAKTVTETVAPVSYYPGWFFRWALLVRESITSQPWHDANPVFTSVALNWLEPVDINIPFCRRCIDAAQKARGGRVFEAWAKDVQRKLKDRLKGLDVLFEL